jgi:hypothetical protein
MLPIFANRNKNNSFTNKTFVIAYENIYVCNAICAYMWQCGVSSTLPVSSRPKPCIAICLGVAQWRRRQDPSGA